MRRSLYTVVLSAGLISGVIGGCFLRPAASPGFRFACQEDDECQALDCSGTTISREKAATLIEGCDSLEVKADPTLGLAFRQSCVAGLCEYRCDLLTAAEDCPASEGLLFCFNGVCASRCGTDDYTKYKFDSNDDFCTDPQTCVPLDASGIDPVLFDSLGGGGGGQGGGQGGQSSAPRDLIEGEGFCGLRCDAAGAPACPPGQYCTGALCLPGCDEATATPCDAGTTCIAFGGFSSCLTTCESGTPESCPEGEICVQGFNVCRPTCLGADAVECPENFQCDVNLAICLPVGGEESTGGDSSGGATT
jgi:hypothetical protein